MEVIDYIDRMITLAMDGDVQGIFFLIALYALVVPGYSFIYQVRVASWPDTRGVLIQQATIEKFGATARVKANQDYVISARYKYSVDGREYYGKRVSPWLVVASHNFQFLLNKQMSHIDRDDTGNLRVYFNPANPAKSYLLKPGKLSQSLTAISAVTPLLLYLIKYHL